MALTQESVLFYLIASGGKATKSEIVAEFKHLLNCVDPAEKQEKRARFKTLVNDVATVREVDGVRYVVLKKMYRHLLDGVQTAEKTDHKGIPLSGEQQRPPVQREDTESCDDAAAATSTVSAPKGEQASCESNENPAELLSPVQLALRRSKFGDGRVKRMLNFEIQEQNADGNDKPTRIKNKPYGLPLRMPHSGPRTVICKLKSDPGDPAESPVPASFKNKQRPLLVEDNVSSAQVRGAVKSTKASEEFKETRSSSVVPLEHSEHEWLVKCAAGHWSQVYGLLLRDKQLAEKRDFMSGFTALHWVAKCGNSNMLLKIIRLAKESGVDIDINAKTHGGYTPLHIATLHGQDYIVAMLVGELGADPNIRDNCGKKPYHYLHKGSSATLREMLVEPKAQQVEDRALHEKEELDLIPDLSKGLHSISRLFQPHMMSQKKKHKQRPRLYSLTDNPREEQEDRIVSDVLI